MSGEKYSVNKSEYQAIMKADKGIFVPRLEVYINKSSISTAYPESRADEIEDRKSQMNGVLHDGARVIRRFGEWVIANNMVCDDSGNTQPIRLDPEYYPEVAKDCVATEKEWKEISAEKDYYQIVGYEPEKKYISGGLNQLKEKHGKSKKII